MPLGRWFEISFAVLALAAAGFWFASAYPPLPPMLTYWGFTPETDPFRQAIVFSAKMNGYAAICSGIGATVGAVRLFIGK